VLTELDYPVMETEIPLAEWPYAVSFGTAPAEFGAYDDLLAELKSRARRGRRAPGAQASATRHYGPVLLSRVQYRRHGTSPRRPRAR